MTARSVPATPALHRASCAPAASLSQAIVRLWGVEQLHAPQEAMPDGCVDLIVSLSPEPGAYVIGTLRRATTIDRLPGHTLVGLSLQPGHAAAVLGCPASELTGQVVALGDVLGRGASDLVERVRGVDDFAGRARVLEAFVQDRVTTARPDARPQPCVQRAVDAIRASEGRVSIATLARDQHCTVRVLQRAFQRHVGVSPKQFARIMRFHAALRALRRGDRMIEVAFALGYADQAHFVRDFGEIAGRTPSSFGVERGSTHLFNT